MKLELEGVGRSVAPVLFCVYGQNGLVEAQIGIMFGIKVAK